jgi:ATP-dependent DNA helicase Q4
MEKELKQIDDAIQENIPELTDDDRAAYEIPKTDEGYLKVLKERFGHDSFKEGQLEAIKIILEKKENALVVLATGGGKSLIYQFTT